MAAKRVIIDVENRVATVLLNRPEKHNGLDVAMFFAIDKAIRQLSRNRGLRAIIVAGNGPSFCSGLDFKSAMADKKGAMRLFWKWWPTRPNIAQRVTVGWRRLKVPVIMALHGKCWGGGMQIALGGDFRIAAPDTSLSVMEARFGLIPDMGGTLAMRENMAADQAMKLAMTAEPITAQRALELNLVTQIAEQPMQAAMELANQLMQRSPDTCAAIKRLYHRSWCSNEGKILAGETLNQWRMLLGKNRQIAVKRELGDKEREYLSN